MLAHPMVDPFRIQSDSIIEIADVFGVEAAREKIMNEMKTMNSATMESGPAHCHYTIYADEMTATGHVTSIERPGLTRREGKNVMLRLSTASPIQVIEDAALRNMTDRITGVSSQLMIGQSPLFGSAYNTILINEEFVRRHNANVNDLLSEL
jgi:DNA-directed RNA polymerase II subunit RPB1